MRVFHDLTDIVLDAPNAYHTLSKFVESGVDAGFVSTAVCDELPSRYSMPSYVSHNPIFIMIYYCRGRKRYVSEGDGGAIKLPED